MRRETKIQIVKIVLKTIAAAGIISMAVLAPNAIQALGLFREKRKFDPKYHVKTAITRLKAQKLIEFKNERGKVFVRLTEKGREKLIRYRLQETFADMPRKWDKKWRIVIFDIREEKKKIRNFLRRELISIGFIRLQNSVWVYPYDCEEFVILLKAYLHIGKDILYITADKIENDKWLKKKFCLI